MKVKANTQDKTPLWKATGTFPLFTTERRTSFTEGNRNLNNLDNFYTTPRFDSMRQGSSPNIFSSSKKEEGYHSSPDIFESPN